MILYSDISKEDYEKDTVRKNTFIILKGDTLGKVLKSHVLSKGQIREGYDAMYFGTTHEENIKPETVVETVFQKQLVKNGQNLSQWKNFIESFDLRSNAFKHPKFQTFFKHENAVEDPSPGFRLVLLFEGNLLKGFLHSRNIRTEKTISQQLDRDYQVTFVKDYPLKEQMEFVIYFNKWLQGVD